MNEPDSLAPAPLTSVDSALLDAHRVFSDGQDGDALDRLSPALAASLRWAEGTSPANPERALQRLRAAHNAQRTPDLSRIHVSWWLRALRDECESVRRTVAAGLPRGLADAIREEFGFREEDLATDRPPDPGARRHALALWTAQLVGDRPDREDDPPVIHVLTTYDSTILTRLFARTGLAKWAFSTRTLPGLSERDEERMREFRARLQGIDSRFLKVIEHDLATVKEGGAKGAALTGMLSLARQLNGAEPYRARWALQHLPYQTAKGLRSLMGSGTRRTPMLARWEAELMTAALESLRLEGRLSTGGGDEA